MSANSPLVNAHITRVVDDGGDVSTIDQAWLQTVYAWLIANSLDKSLLHWADPAFGVAKTGTNITRIYDLGSTWLPRSLDLTPRDSTKTIYSVTGLNSSIPAFVNSDGSSQIYWGRNKRYNQIRRKAQLTIAALYERTQTSADICFAGISTSSSTNDQSVAQPNFSGSSLIAGISLVHTSGSPGSIQFSINDATFTSKVASVTASGATTQIAIGTYDGTTMTAYSDGTGGTGVTTLFRDPFFGTDSALAGARIGGLFVAMPVLTVGDTMAHADYPSPNTPPLAGPSAVSFTNAYAQFKASSIIVFGSGLTPTQAASLTALLQTRAGLTSSVADIKADYGALGDAVKVTAVFSITSGTKNLSCTTNQWAAGDAGTGKYIAITGAGPAGATLQSTIITFTDAQHIVINNNASTTLSSSTQTVEWGHDDYDAFQAFKDDFQGRSGIVLTIPAGRYLFVKPGFAGTAFTSGITELHVTGTGSPILSDLLGTGAGYFLGCGAVLANDGSHSARIQSLNAGATTATLVNAGDATIFTGVTWGVLAGWDMQDDQQYPMNPYYYEYIPITSVVGSAITFGSAVQKSYKSTWPLYFPGNAFALDDGGPATLYVLNAIWDCTHVYTGLVFDQLSAQVNAGGRNITFTNCTALNFGINISGNQTWTGNNLDCSLASNEIDKINGNVTINGGTWHGIDMQSSSVDLLTMNNVHVTSSFNGTAKKTVMSGCTIDPDIGIAPHSFGSANEFRADACAFNGGFGSGGVLETDVTGVGAYTMSGGVISRVKASGTGAPPQWATPNGWAYWVGSQGASGVFQILDMTESGSSIHVQTDQSGGFPANIPGTLGIKTHPSPIFKLTSCTGSSAALAWSLAPDDGPMNSYWQQTYTANGTYDEVQVIGRLVSVKFNVTSAGSGRFTFGAFGAFVHTIASGTVQTWSPSIDLATTGLRTVTFGGPDPSLGTDSGLPLPSDATGIWLVLGQIIPERSASGGSITLEIITDQGIESAAPVTASVVLMPMGCM